jgi:hypothetical protein
MNVFLSLVRNDLRLKKTRTRQHRNLFWSYLAAAVLLGIGWYTWSVCKGFMQPQFLLWWLPCLIFVPNGYSFFLIKQEWRAGTASWWLSLPYSRHLLLGAKFTACLIRVVQLFAIGFICIILLGIEAIFLRPDIWRMDILGDLLLKGSSVFLLLIALSPLTIMFGLTLAVLGHSAWKAVSPLFWFLYIGFMNLFMFTAFKSYSLIWKLDDPAQWKMYNIGMPDLPFFTSGITILLIVAFVVVLPVLFFLFAARVLERQAEV